MTAKKSAIYSSLALAIVFGMFFVYSSANAQGTNTNNLYFSANNTKVVVDKSGDTLVSWDTSQPSKGYVIYGLESQANTNSLRYEFSSPRDGVISTMHIQNLGELQEDRPYYLRVVSEIGEQRTISNELTFIRESKKTLRAKELASASALNTGYNYNPLTSFFLLIIIIILLIILLKKKGRIYLKRR